MPSRREAEDFPEAVYALKYRKFRTTKRAWAYAYQGMLTVRRSSAGSLRFRSGSQDCPREREGGRQDDRADRRRALNVTIVYALAERESRIRHLTTSEILDSPISSVMTRTVKTCGLDDSLRHVMENMTKWHILHIPVVDQGELCGIVSVDDVVKHAVAEMDMEKGVLQERAHLYQTLEEMR